MTKPLAGTRRTIEAIRGLLATDFADIPEDAQWLGGMTPIAEARSILHAQPAEITYANGMPINPWPSVRVG